MRESPKTNNNNNNKIFIYSKGESPKTNNNKIWDFRAFHLLEASRSFCRPEIDLGRGGVHPNDCWGMGCVVEGWGFWGGWWLEGGLWWVN